MTYASEPTIVPGETPQPLEPDVTPGPNEAPYPEITPDPSPSEAPQDPTFPDNGRPYDLSAPRPG